MKIHWHSSSFFLVLVYSDDIVDLQLEVGSHLVVQTLDSRLQSKHLLQFDLVVLFLLWQVTAMMTAWKKILVCLLLWILQYGYNTEFYGSMDGK